MRRHHTFSTKAGKKYLDETELKGVLEYQIDYKFNLKCARPMQVLTLKMVLGEEADITMKHDERPTLRDLITHRGLSYGQVAKAAKIRERILLKIMSGMEMPSMEQMLNLAKVLGVSLGTVNRAVQTSFQAKYGNE